MHRQYSYSFFIIRETLLALVLCSGGDPSVLIGHFLFMALLSSVQSHGVAQSWNQCSERDPINTALSFSVCECVCVFTSMYTLQTPSVYFWNILSYPSSESIDLPRWKVSFRSFMMCLHISCRSLVCESLKAARRFIFTQWKCFWSRLLSQRWGRTLRMTRALTSFCSSLQIRAVDSCGFASMHLPGAFIQKAF